VTLWGVQPAAARTVAVTASQRVAGARRLGMAILGSEWTLPLSRGPGRILANRAADRKVER
jgi:hypothetical protein